MTKDKKFCIKYTTKKPVNQLNKTQSQNILKHAPGPYHCRKHKHCYWNLSCWKTRHNRWFRQIFVLQKGWSLWHQSIFRAAVFTCSFEVEHVWSWNNMASWNGKQLFWSNDVTQTLHFYIEIHNIWWKEHPCRTLQIQ